MTSLELALDAGNAQQADSRKTLSPIHSSLGAWFILDVVWFGVRTGQDSFMKQAMISDGLLFMVHTVIIIISYIGEMSFKNVWVSQCSP